MTHIYLDNQDYFITTRVLGHKKLLQDVKVKNFIIDKIKDASDRLEVDLIDWCILDDHYHLLITIKHGEDLSKFMNLIQGSSSRFINKNDGLEGRMVWHGYYDHAVEHEEEFYRIKTYILTNPVKHGYVINPEKYLYSSWQSNVEQFTLEGVYDIIGSNHVNEMYFERFE